MAYYKQQEDWPQPCCYDKGCSYDGHVSDEILGKGAGKTAYYSRHCDTDGGRKRNQKSVTKFYNEKYVFDEDFWSREVQGHKKANDLALAWNKSEFCHRKIRVLLPVQNKLVGTENPKFGRKIGEYCLVEDNLPGFEKFNSNTMTIKGCEKMSTQAFSHWTYHHSNGQYLFVDCQGSVDNQSGYVLTDPVIVSRGSFWTSSYGPCDGGKDMMITWFENHKCNSFCRRYWKKASGQKQVYIKPTQNTTYVWNARLHQQNMQNDQPIHMLPVMTVIHE